MGDEAFHGGFGLINLQGLHKPSYGAYWMMHRLGSERLSSIGKNVFASRRDDGIQVIIWNYTVKNKFLEGSPIICELEIEGLDK